MVENLLVKSEKDSEPPCRRMKPKARGGQSSRCSTAKGLCGPKARGGFAATSGACLGQWLAGSPRVRTKPNQRGGDPSMNILVITQESGNHELADLVLQIPGHPRAGGERFSGVPRLGGFSERRLRSLFSRAVPKPDAHRTTHAVRRQGGTAQTQ